MGKDRMSVLQSESKYNALVLRNKAKFIENVIRGKVKLLDGNLSKNTTVTRLEELGLDDALKLNTVRSDNALGTTMSLNGTTNPREENRFDYLLSMPMSSLTADRITGLNKEAQKKEIELERISGTTAKELWLDDLDTLN